MSGWQPIKSAPRDGSHFLAWGVLTVDEYDEDVLIKKGIVIQDVYVAYFVFGGIVEFPFRNTFVQNLKFTHWMPLPAAPVLANPEAA